MPWWRRQPDPEPRRKPSDVEDQLDAALKNLGSVADRLHRVAQELSTEIEQEEGAHGDRNRK